MACGGAGGTHFLNVGGTSRCYNIILPPVERRPAPVVMMHHGMTGSTYQFCNGRFSHAAAEAGFVLLCTQAIGGYWQFSRATVVWISWVT